MIFQKFSDIRAVYKAHLADTFSGKVAAYMEYHHWNKIVFMDRTGLSEDAYSKIRKGKMLRAEKRIVMSLCVGLAVDYCMATDLLQSAGCPLLLNDPVDEAYDFVLTEMRGCSLEDCNAFLESQGIPLLGTKESKPNRIGNKQIT